MKFWEPSTSRPDDRLGVLSATELETYARLSEQFESAWSSRPDLPPDPEEFLPDDCAEPLSGLLLLRHVKVELEYRSERNAFPSPEQLFQRYAALRDDPVYLVDVLAWGSRLEDLSHGGTCSGFDLPSLAEKFPAFKDRIVARRASLYREFDGKFPDDLVPEDCTLIEELKHGGMSRVVRVWNVAAQREEVVKINDPRPSCHHDVVGRFLREIQLAGSLTGGQVVPVYATGRLGGHLYYTMPFLRGGSLGDRIDAGTLGLREGVVVLREVARAVEKLHAYGPEGRVTPIVHRDLKPQNILFPGPDLSDPRITDLGLAKLLDESAGPECFKTETGESLGTPGYMAPEQVRSTIGAIGPATDVYALGAILYEMLTGRRPVSGATPYERALNTLMENPASPRELAPKRSPRDLSAVAMKALKKVPERRYSSAAAFADELDRWLNHKPVLAREPSVLAHLVSAAVRYPKATAVTLAFVASLIIGAVVSTSLYYRVSQQKARADLNAMRRAAAISDLWQGVDRGLARTGLTTLRQDVLETAAAALNEVVKENDGIGSIGLGQTLNQQGQVLFLLGRTKEALKASERAYAVFEGLPRDHETWLGMASSLQQSGRILHALGEPAKGRRKTEQAIRLFHDLVADRPDDLDIRFGLGRAETNLGNFLTEQDPAAGAVQYAVALAQFTELRRLSGDSPRSVVWEARTRSNLGLALLRLKRLEEAVIAQAEAAGDARRVAADLPEDSEILNLLASCENNLGEALGEAGQLEKADVAFTSALEVYRKLARRFPEETEYHWGVSMVQTSRAKLFADAGRWGDALPLLTEAGAGFDALQDRLKKNPEFEEHVRQHGELEANVRRALAELPR